MKYSKEKYLTLLKDRLPKSPLEIELCDTLLDLSNSRLEESTDKIEDPWEDPFSRIAIEKQYEWEIAGLAGGLYEDYARALFNSYLQEMMNSIFEENSE